MTRYFVAVGFVILAASFQAVVAQELGVERSSLFTLEDGARIEDAGVIIVASGRFARSEAFEIVRGADGSRVITSVIAGADESYRVEGRWTYDAQDQAVSAVGKASYDGAPAAIEITATPPTAKISVRAGQVERTLPAACDFDCLIDMGPSVLPMFTMTRRYDSARGGAQTFHWIGQALTSDQVLLEGTAEIRFLGKGKAGEIEVLQYVFVESLTNAVSGEVTSFAFNLWVDADHRPMAFGTVGGTLGVRDGYAEIPVALPAVFD